MKFFLGAVGVAATLTQSWFYFNSQPILLAPDELSDVCTVNLTASSTWMSNESFVSSLSIVHTVDRAAEIAYMATNLKNEKRSWPIDGQDLPVYMGPVAQPGSVFEKLQTQDLVTLSALKPDTPELMAALAMRWLPQLNSTEAYTRFYELFHPIVDAPTDSVDHGDVGFGASRLSLRGFNLRAIRESDDDPEDETLTAENVAKVFATVDNKLFIVDLATIGQWGDPSVPRVERDEESVAGKYLPSVIGYFCFNEQLLPLAIKLVDSDITYTPFDSADEWQLAKTALNAAEATFQQMQHFSESHTLSIPSAETPVRALLMRHFALDFGLEQQAGIVLFNTSTPLDRTFGIGAAGCVRLLEDQRTRISLLDDVYSDARERGIQQLPHKYVAYGKLHADAISTFVGSFLDVYYADDDAVKTDVELQQWAAACAKIPHLRAFPAAFENKETLHKLLARLVYQSVVKHHAMNGECRCALEAAAESQGACGHPKIDVFSYLQPRELFPAMIFLSALFNRPRPEETTLTSVYHVAPFTDDPRLHTAIRAYDAELQAIDNFIVANEQHEMQPYRILRPGNLPQNTWI
ncbi:Lipoxygenase, C-terminal [Phytophthora cactorum]|nr:Lipoxygenase, C-terminal [Phytophthora cactorum]